MYGHVDPVDEGRVSFAEGTRVKVIPAAQQLEKEQRAAGNWKDGHAAYCGQECTVEVAYPNGDVAVSFDDGTWLRLTGKVVTAAAGSATAPLTPAPMAVPPGVPAAFATRFTQQVAAKPAPEAPQSSPVASASSAPTPAPSPVAESARRWQVGDRVRVRDYEDHAWRVATVTGFDPSGVNPQCTVDGHRKGFVWRQVELVAEAVPAGIAAAQQRLAEAERRREALESELQQADSECLRLKRMLAARQGAADAAVAAALVAACVGGTKLGLSVGDKVHVVADKEQLEKACRASAVGWDARLEGTAGKNGTVVSLDADGGAARVKVEGEAAELSYPAAVLRPGQAPADPDKYVVPDTPVDDEAVAAVEEIWKKAKHGARRKGVDKHLELKGAPGEDLLEFWDLREQGAGFGEEKTPCEPGSMMLEMFYFGELKDAGDPAKFRKRMVKRLAECGIKDVVADWPLRDAGCMYALIAVPAKLTHRQAAQLGHMVFEDFGKESSGGGHAGDGAAAKQQQQPGCAQQ